MKILLDGYLDNNLGDDAMLLLAAEGLSEHELFTASADLKIDNVKYSEAKSGYDCYLKVIGSGFILDKMRWMLYRVRDMRAERKYSPKRAVINCNISGFKNKAAEKLTQCQLRGYDFITVRDSYSYEYIKKNIPNVHCEQYPDMVFSMPESMIPDVQSEEILGIAVHNRADCGALARVADGYIEETGKQVVLLCFDTGVENDVLAAERVYNAARYREMIKIVSYTSISDMILNMKRCEVILGIRFHSIILSARMNIPFVPMAYSDKTVNALKSIGYNNMIYPSYGFKTEDVLKSILGAKPYNLDRSIIEDARMHIIKFNEYIKQQV